MGRKRRRDGAECAILHGLNPKSSRDSSIRFRLSRISLRAYARPRRWDSVRVFVQGPEVAVVRVKDGSSAPPRHNFGLLKSRKAHRASPEDEEQEMGLEGTSAISFIE